MEDRIGKPCCLGALGAHKLDALAHSNGSRRLHEQELEGRKRQGIFHFGLEMPFAGEMRRDGSIERASCLDAAKRQPRSERPVLRRELLEHRRGAHEVAQACRAPPLLRDKRERCCTGTRELRLPSCHERCSQVSSSACWPRAQAEASISRLPSGFTESAAKAPSAQPKSTLPPASSTLP